MICCLAHCGYLSETSRMIAVYKALRRRGQKAIMATHGGTYEWIFTEEGIPYQPVEPQMTTERCRRFVAVNTGKGAGSFYTTEELRRHVHSEIEFFKTEDVSVVVTGFVLSSALSARRAGIPLAVTHLGCFVPPIFERGMLPYRTDFENPLSRLLPSSWKRSFLNWLYPRIGFFTGPFKRVAGELGISPVRGILDLFMGDWTLVTEAPEILGISREEMESWRPEGSRFYRPGSRLKYVGAIYAKLFGSIPEDVAAFLRTPLPKVYVALTSGKREYLDYVYSALEGMNIRAIICSTVHRDYPDASANILIREHLPSHRIMPLVDLAIVHGGQGSVQTAIASGTPLIGFPLQAEQNLNLSLVESHGAGINASLKTLKRGGLHTLIEKVLSEPRYRENACSLRDLQARYDGAANTAKFLLELNRASPD